MRIGFKQGSEHPVLFTFGVGLRMMGPHRGKLNVNQQPMVLQLQLLQLKKEVTTCLKILYN